VDEGRKRVLGIMAATLTALHMENLGTDGTFIGFCELELRVRPVCP